MQAIYSQLSSKWSGSSVMLELAPPGVSHPAVPGRARERAPPAMPPCAGGAPSQKMTPASGAPGRCPPRCARCWAATRPGRASGTTSRSPGRPPGQVPGRQPDSSAQDVHGRLARVLVLGENGALERRNACLAVSARGRRRPYPRCDLRPQRRPVPAVDDPEPPARTSACPATDPICPEAVTVSEEQPPRPPAHSAHRARADLPCGRSAPPQGAPRRLQDRNEHPGGHGCRDWAAGPDHVPSLPRGRKPSGMFRGHSPSLVLLI